MSDNNKEWFEELGRAIAEESNFAVGSEIEHQCGTVWVTDINTGMTHAISSINTEE